MTPFHRSPSRLVIVVVMLATTAASAPPAVGATGAAFIGFSPPALAPPFGAGRPQTIVAGPDGNVWFKDGGGVTRGSTSVAVRTQ